MNSTLVISNRKNHEWITFKLDNNESIKILIKDHKSRNPNLVKVVIECPKDIRIERVLNEENGNK